MCSILLHIVILLNWKSWWYSKTAWWGPTLNIYQEFIENCALNYLSPNGHNFYLTNLPVYFTFSCTENFHYLSAQYWAISIALLLSSRWSLRAHLMEQCGHSKTVTFIVVFIFETLPFPISLYRCYVYPDTIQSSPNWVFGWRRIRLV